MDIKIFDSLDKARGWVEWHPANPLPKGNILVMFLDGTKTTFPADPSVFDWNFEGAPGDILAYKEV